MRVMRLNSLGTLIAVLATSYSAIGGPLPPNTVSMAEAEDFAFGRDIAFGGSRFAEYPAVAISKGTVHLAWAEYDGQRDRIFVSRMLASAIEKRVAISEESADACWPVLVSADGGGVIAVWSQLRDGHWNIAVRNIAPSLGGNITYIPQASNRPVDRWRPAATDFGGRLYIAWEESDGQSCRIVSTQYVQPPQLMKLTTHSGDGPAFRPDLAAGKDSVWLAWDEVTGGQQYEVYLSGRRDDQWSPPIRVTNHPALDAAAGLAVDDQDRVWVAWHSDRSETRQWDIEKWVQVRCYDGHRWFEPQAPVPGRQTDPRGEDQGFEFPTLCFDGTGRLWLFGRPSQGFNAVCYQGDRWSEVYRFDRSGWGGRGRRVRAVADESGLWTVRRDLRQNFVRRIESPTPKVTLSVREFDPQQMGEDAQPAPPPELFERSGGEVGPYEVLFGDVHTHSWMSDGSGTPDELYHRARTAYGLDFMVVTDHDDFVGNRIIPSEWSRLGMVTNLFNDPPRFATIRGYEWTDARVPRGDGHKNVYYRGDGPMLWHTDPQTHDAATLFARLADLKGLAFPHHIGWTGVDWKSHDESVQTNVEICSVHGAYEFMGNLPIRHRGGMPGRFVQDGLFEGHRFGLVAGSDGHGLLWHHGIARRRNPWTHGLTAVLATERSREAIWDALAARRCYATSGPRMFIDFRVNGHLMGEAITSSTAPLITATVRTAHPIQYVTVVRNNDDLLTSGGNVTDCKINYTDTDWSAENGDSSFYYLRVVLKNGEMAWTSPVFVTAADGQPGDKKD